MSKSIRLTVGQALVQFVANQYVVRDGRQNRFIEGIWGIFGHGNVSGLGQGIVEFADQFGLRFYRPQHEQGMVHIAAAFAKHRNRLSTFACTTSIGPGALNMVTGAGVATVNRLPVLLLPSDYFANRVPDPCFNRSNTRWNETSARATRFDQCRDFSTGSRARSSCWAACPRRFES